MEVDRLADAIADDRAAGVVPMAVVATIGTTSSTERSIRWRRSPTMLRARADLAARRRRLRGRDGHACPTRAHMFDGAALADSLVVNPHKWLFTPFDLSVLFCRRMNVVRQRLLADCPSICARPSAGSVRNLMDTGIQLGRRFRALKLWMILRHFGAEGIRARLVEHVRLARLFADWVDATPGWERVAPVPFAVVCFRHHPPGVDDEAVLERLNAAVMDRVNRSGEAFLSHTKLDRPIRDPHRHRQHQDDGSARGARMGTAARGSRRVSFALMPGRSGDSRPRRGLSPRCFSERDCPH